MSIVFAICFALLMISLGLSAYRIFVGPTAGDRILALDLLAVTASSAILLYAISSGQRVFIDVVVVFGIIIFFGTVAIARSIAREPKDP